MQKTRKISKSHWSKILLVPETAERKPPRGNEMFDFVTPCRSNYHYQVSVGTFENVKPRENLKLTPFSPLNGVTYLTAYSHYARSVTT